MSNEINTTLINSLKGRVSKALNTKLQADEMSGLEGIYNAIDSLILSKKQKSDINKFQENLQLCFKMLKGTKKAYIQEHIIPLLNKVSIKKWGNNE